MANKVYREFIKTPVGRLSFPALFEKTETPNGKLCYSATLAFPKDEATKTSLRAIKAAMENVARKNFGETINIKTLKFKAFKDGNVPNTQGVVRDEWKDCYVLTVQTNNRPGLVGPDGKTYITDPDELYAGCWVRAHLVVCPFNHPVGGRGVTLFLNNLQKIKDDAPFAGGPRAEDVFDAVASEGDGGVPVADDDVI